MLNSLFSMLFKARWKLGNIYWS